MYVDIMFWYLLHTLINGPKSCVYIWKEEDRKGWSLQRALAKKKKNKWSFACKSILGSIFSFDGTTKERRRRNATVGNIQSSGISFSATEHFSKSPYFVSKFI